MIDVPPVGMPNAVRQPLMQIVEELRKLNQRFGTLETSVDNLSKQLERVEIEVAAVRNHANRIESKVNKVAFNTGTKFTTSGEYPCPINGCQHVFKGGRNGWDTHVASPAVHPHWLPHVAAGDERKRIFEDVYRYWFID